MADIDSEDASINLGSNLMGWVSLLKEYIFTCLCTCTHISYRGEVRGQGGTFMSKDGQCLLATSRT